MGCIYNVACCYYLTGKFANAEKWFTMALRNDPMNQDCLAGKCLSLLRLGQTQKALKTICAIDLQNFTSKLFSKQQITFFKAICYRLMEQWPLSLQLYESMREGCRKK